MFKPVTLLLSLLLLQSAASAATLYVSPNGSGSTCSDGAPCALSSAITSAQSGDTIYLKNGFYGDLSISGRRNTGYITISAQPGHNPGLRGVVVRNSSRWIIRGLNISPELTSPYISGYLVRIHADSDNITVEDNNLFFTRDSSAWAAADWTSIPARYAILTEGPNVIIRNNTLKNVYFGIVIKGDGTLMEHNTINGIGGDGIVGGANDLVIQYNTLKNFYKVDDNHDDGMQFHRGNDRVTPIENITIRGNLIINREPGLTNPLLGRTQGILADNTPLINFVVENNVIVTPAYHGISIYGATDSKIVNNIVFDPTREYPIRITLDDRGQNTIVRNNMACNYMIGGTAMTADHNIDIDDYDPDALFVDYRNYNVRHRPGSPAIDAGSRESAPDRDIEGISRPQGLANDIGAYEYTSSIPLTFILGDVNGDGSSNIIDVTLAARHVAELTQLQGDALRRANANGDLDDSGQPKIDILDVILIARRAVGLITSF